MMSSGTSGRVLGSAAEAVAALDEFGLARWRQEGPPSAARAVVLAERAVAETRTLALPPLVSDSADAVLRVLVCGIGARDLHAWRTTNASTDPAHPGRGSASEGLHRPGGAAVCEVLSVGTRVQGLTAGLRSAQDAAPPRPLKPTDRLIVLSDALAEGSPSAHAARSQRHVSGGGDACCQSSHLYVRDIEAAMVRGAVVRLPDELHPEEGAISADELATAVHAATALLSPAERYRAMLATTQHADANHAVHASAAAGAPPTAPPPSSPLFGEAPTKYVAIIGCGALGCMAVLAVRHLLPSTIVIAADDAPERRQMAAGLGADHAVAMAELSELVPLLARERGGCDGVIETLGASDASALGIALDAVADGGALALVGLPPATAAHGAGASLGSNLGSNFGSDLGSLGSAAAAQRCFDRHLTVTHGTGVRACTVPLALHMLRAQLGRGRPSNVRAVVTQRHSLELCQQAYQLAAAAGAVGKALLYPDMPRQSPSPQSPGAAANGAPPSLAAAAALD